MYLLYNFFNFFTFLKYAICREDNNRLVPKILDRLQLYYTQFCEENEMNQNTKPFSHLNNDQTINDNTSFPRKRSNFLIKI